MKPHFYDMKGKTKEKRIKRVAFSSHRYFTACPERRGHTQYVIGTGKDPENPVGQPTSIKHIR
jgi:hypothetical protein